MSIGNTHEFFIQLHLTENCNLSCRHCYQEGRKTNEMSLSEIKDAINEISDTINEWSETYDIAFLRSFNVTGGEPLLFKDLFEILNEIRKKDFEIYLLTNGTLIDKKKAKALLNAGIKGVQVSLEGPENIHDSIRGRGSFFASLNGVRNLLEAGLQVTLNVTLSAVNADHFINMIKIASTLGVQRLGFSRLVPSGKGLGMLDEMIDKTKTKEIYEKIFSLNTDNLKIVTGDPVATQSTIGDFENDLGDFPSGGSAAGISGLTILPDGTITPCRRLPIPIGNVRKDSIREVWATSSVLESLRDRAKYKGKCGLCKRWTGCRGCRAIAYAFSKTKGKNDFLSDDPQCFI